MAGVVPGGVEELAANQTGEEERVDGESDDLQRERAETSLSAPPCLPLIGLQ